ncbi:MAG TPA: hypothetical protein VG937_24670 [Polyangiaceae bacterium]|nr:hypothetical protein [Polyangiaceae bacterium]
MASRAPPGTLRMNSSLSDPRTKLALLERFGLSVLRRSPSHPAVAGEDDPIHVLNPEELRALRRIERGAVLRAATAGALSGSASAGAAIWAHRFLGPNGAPLSNADAVRFWGAVGAATLVASAFEIGFLYWDALRTVHRMATAAGLKLSEQDLSREQTEIALALARAALELPNPPHAELGVDPRRESVRWIVALASLLYKAKIALTNFMLKGVLRSIIGQSLATVALELVTVPVTAIWNAVICWFVVREARLRTMGPSAALELVTLALSDLSPGAAGIESALRAVASAIVRTQDLHPNHLAVLRVLHEKSGTPAIEALDDSRRFLERLRDLRGDDQKLALRLLVIAAILDGRLTRPERRLLTEAFQACGSAVDLAQVERLRRALVAGRQLDFSLVQSISDGPPSG